MSYLTRVLGEYKKQDEWIYNQLLQFSSSKYNKKCFQRALETYYNTEFYNFDTAIISSEKVDYILNCLGFVDILENRASIDIFDFQFNYKFLYFFGRPGRTQGHVICTNDISNTDCNVYGVSSIYIRKPGNLFNKIWWRLQRVRLLGR